MFYGAALARGHTHLAIVEYWRWWVVHLWVEGFFEVFATVVIAFFFARLGLLGPESAAARRALVATIFLAGGIIGTLHHLYFRARRPSPWPSARCSARSRSCRCSSSASRPGTTCSCASAALGAEYQLADLLLRGRRVLELVGAGLFGFMINPPIALYYMQGLNTTPVHGHAALFGVYGMLGIGLMLFCAAGDPAGLEWRNGLIRFAFWAMNVGLMAMVVLSLLPVGLMQTWASVEHGYWYARSPEFLQTPVLQTLRWMRAPGDTLFTAGIIALVLFVAGLSMGFSYAKDQRAAPGREPEPARL